MPPSSAATLVDVVSGASRLSDLDAEGARVLAVCNACRYCEQYCPVFPAMERRLTFGPADLEYLANLCHNCGECLYACQYAPPHEFDINVPRTLAELRLASYEAHAWPGTLATLFRRHSVATSLAVAAGMALLLAIGIAILDPGAWARPAGSGAFYDVVPHAWLVSLFGATGLFAATAIGTGILRFWRRIAASTPRATTAPRQPKATARNDAGQPTASVSALHDVLTLAHLHGGGVDCVEDEESRRPWRRTWHHATFYGFALCFASTSVAALYHAVLGWHAPYAYTSLPVVLGTLGGLGLIVGPLGLLLGRRRRDPLLSDPAQAGLDVSFSTLLLLTSATGLLLLALRHSSAMPALLVVHLGAVLALFVTMPYGKFVHGFYRSAALFLSARETLAEHR